jgi:L-type amino acid transporter 9
LAFFFIISGDIKSLIAFSSFLIWLFYAIAMAALMVMRKTRKDAYRRYKVRHSVSSEFWAELIMWTDFKWGSLVCFQVPLFIPVLVIIVALFLCLVPIITDPSPKYFFALLFIGLGIILYVPLVYYKFRPKWMSK